MAWLNQLCTYVQRRHLGGLGGRRPPKEKEKRKKRKKKEKEKRKKKEGNYE